MARYFFILLFIFSTVHVQGQGYSPSGVDSGMPKIVLKGKVVEQETGAILEYATVAVVSQKDSLVVGGAITDAKGNFEVAVRPGQYLLRVEFVSFEEQIIPDVVVSADQTELDLGTIWLQSNAEILQEVVVTGEKSEVEFALDRKIYTVGKDMAKTGGSASDILDNIPSVSVDVEGNVSLRGNEDVRILIDGKPSGLVGLSSTDALRQLQASQIEKVEIVTNPSAKYDAAGTAGIINIVLKKNSDSGFNGTFDLNTGYPHNHGGSFAINRRKEKYNLFASYGLMYRRRPGSGSTQANYFLEDSTYSTDRQREHERGGLSHNFRGGAEFYINEFNSLTGSFLFRKSDEDNEYDISYRDFDSNGDLYATTLRKDNETEVEENHQYSLSYTKTFKEKDRKFEALVQYWEESETENSNIAQRELDAVGSEEDVLQQKSLNDESEKTLLTQFDYFHPIGEDGRFEGGYRSTIRDIGNDFKVEEFVEGDWETLPDFTNNFLYGENIYAVYTIYGNKIGSFGYQAGLRAEATDIRTELQETSDVTDKSYLNFFPSGHLTYEFSENTSVQLSYSRRIRRPHFWYLNPFSSFSDPRFIRTGNPDLNPEYTNSTEIAYLKNWSKVTMSSSLYYRYTTGVIQRITTVDEDGVSYSRPENLSDRNDFGLELISTWDAAEWWRLSGSLNFFRSITDGGNLGPEFEADNFSWMGRMNSLMTIAKKTDFQMRFNYRAPMETTQGRRYAYYYMDMGFSREILKKKGTISLNVRDVFNTRVYSGATFGDNFYSVSDFQWSSRQLLIGFNYRLNQQKKRGRNGSGGDGGDFDGDAAF